MSQELQYTNDAQDLPKLEPVANPLNLLPVSLKEAAHDSPSFRAACVHFTQQIENVERWLEQYLRAASRLCHELSSIEGFVKSYIDSSVPLNTISETVLDPDYTALLLRRYNDAAKESWSGTSLWMRNVEYTVIEPIKIFVANHLANLKAIRRQLDKTQKIFDHAISRYASQSKTKDASAFKEDAFQLHEARKAYLKDSMDFCVAAPQVRLALDKLLVQLFSDRWSDIKNSSDFLANTLTKSSQDVDRVRCWSTEMEKSEKMFIHELHVARRQIEEAAEAKARPSRELANYVDISNLSNTPAASLPLQGLESDKNQKGGWLYMKTLYGKPARTVWVRHWFYLKDGVFGWLQQAPRLTSVGESDKFGVLLCSTRPPPEQEERAFCFEVKTKDVSLKRDVSLILQAESHIDRTEWIRGFELVKRSVLATPKSTNASTGAAFSVTPPIDTDFSIFPERDPNEDGIERSVSMNIESTSPVTKAGSDLRRLFEDDGEPTSSKREAAARLMQKWSKASSSSPLVQNSPALGGGIASLIAASHSAVPGAENAIPKLNITTDVKKKASEVRKMFASTMPTSSLAPSTFANFPVPTQLSKSAVIICTEKGISAYGASHIPAGLMANVWGSCNSPYVNQLGRNLSKAADAALPNFNANTLARALTSHTADNAELSGSNAFDARPGSSLSPQSDIGHRRIQSAAPEMSSPRPVFKSEFVDTYPPNYPLPLKAQDSQFRMLFPTVSREEMLVLVFRATWNASEQLEFPGRVYVTTKEIYFYSNHLGLVLMTGVGLDSIAEITSAPGKNCDFLYLYLKRAVRTDGATRITVKTFLESQKLLQRRLDYLIQPQQGLQPVQLEQIIKTIIHLELKPEDSPAIRNGWEVAPQEGADNIASSSGQDLKPSLRIDGSLDTKKTSKNTTKFRLPPYPVEFTPQGFIAPVIERKFDVTAESLFHVLVGDKSTLFQLLYCQKGATRLVQTPWARPEQGPHRREMKYEVQNPEKTLSVSDYQVIDVINDHLCYVITERKTGWFLPYSNFFTLLVKIVITHVAKPQCKLSIFTRVVWSKKPVFGQSWISRQASYDLQTYANNLADIAADQASRLGVQGGTNAKKAIAIFGLVGHSAENIQLVASDLASADLRGLKKIRYKSLATLIFYDLRRLVVTYAYLGFGYLLEILKWVADTFLLQKVLITTLGFSILFNLIFSWKESWAWWQDRRASVYMSKLGVKANTVMSQSIWIQDLDNYTAQTTADFSHIGNYGTCGVAFSDMLAQSAASSWKNGAEASSSSAAAAAEAAVMVSDSKTMDQIMLHRIARNRHKYGKQRHDLMVSLRLVGRLERDMLQAEWEQWVYGEAARCKRVSSLVKQRPDKGTTSKDGGRSGDDGKIAEEAKDLENWWNDYCQSCTKAASVI